MYNHMYCRSACVPFVENQVRNVPQITPYRFSGWSKKRRDRRWDTWRSIRHGPLCRRCLRATDTRRDTGLWRSSDGTDDGKRLTARRYVVLHPVFNF